MTALSTTTSDRALLAPSPRRLRRLEGSLGLGRGLALGAATLSDAPVSDASVSDAPGWESIASESMVSESIGPALARLRSACEAVELPSGDRGAPIRLERRTTAPTDLTPASAEAYRLTIDREGVRVASTSHAGLSHGLSTLTQWVRLHAGKGALPSVDIEDAPRIAHRGLVLDISRSRVPTMSSLFRLVDRLASWKLNQLQLYIEHTFAYSGHEIVWRDASPLTPAEARELDAYCRARHIELVPNQNSFGHLHRWLEHERYRPLAECPEGIEHPFADHPTPFSLCPLDPGSLDLLADLYDQLLPCFSSGGLHVGFDETMDLGRGRSRETVERVGVGALYADFLNQVAGLAAGYGRTVQIWGDILAKHPEVLPRLPEGSTVMDWGYEADHPFAERAARLAEAGVDFHLSPGTSGWLSLAGRWSNASANIRSAVRAAVDYGARGLTLTDWGDQGHLQPPIVSLPAYLLAAALAWNPDSDPIERPEVISPLLDRWAFDTAPGRGPARALLEMSELYDLPGGGTFNGSPLFFLLTRPDMDLGQPRLRGLAREGLERTRDTLIGLKAAARSFGPELAWVRGALFAASSIGLARLRHGAERSVRDLPAAERARLASMVAALIEEHGPLWRLTSREGGRSESVRFLERTRTALTHVERGG